jgi:hypothetical protein
MADWQALFSGQNETQFLAAVSFTENFQFVCLRLECAGLTQPKAAYQLSCRWSANVPGSEITGPRMKMET